MSSSILLIYTGGTIGMVKDIKSNSLVPFNFEHLTAQIPELNQFNYKLDSYSFKTPIDSSDMHPSIWIELVEIIEQNYIKYDGFVILHGSDTMAYTASALSFMLQNLKKPVVLTGSQLPIGIIRTDGKENLITAIEIAAAKDAKGVAIVPEVAIYFEYKLYRGNRTHKYNSEHFDAFQSPNYQPLAEAGVHIQYNKKIIQTPNAFNFKTDKKLDVNVGVLKVFPGISENYVNAVLETKNLKAIVLETFGSGNATTKKWFLNAVSNAIKNNIVIFNVTQCNRGSVLQGKYETSKDFDAIGVVGGYDITFEAAITKLMFVLGKELSLEKTKKLLTTPISGELTIN